MIITISWQELTDAIVALCSDLEPVKLQSKGTTLIVKSVNGKRYFKDAVISTGPQTYSVSSHTLLNRLVDTQDCEFVRIEINNGGLIIHGVSDNTQYC